MMLIQKLYRCFLVLRLESPLKLMIEFIAMISYIICFGRLG